MSTTDPTGRARGGAARAEKLSAEERKAISQRGVEAKRQLARELASLPKATHDSADRPLKIGDIELPCYVLEDGTRLLSERGLIAGLGMSRGSSNTGSSPRHVAFFESEAIRPFITDELMAALKAPVKFHHRRGGRLAYGYPATLLADICDAVLSARKAGKLPPRQASIADQCEVLVRGFARVGIIALIDEATGYQRDRAKDALAKILEAFVAKELQPYVKTFPSEYYEQLFRLRGLEFPPEKPQLRPQYFGVLTNDIVYERLAPGLLEELKKQAAKDSKKAHLHRRLTQELGHPKLKDHLTSVVTVMKLSKNYTDFIEKLNFVHPRFGATIPLQLEEADR